MKAGAMRSVGDSGLKRYVPFPQPSRVTVQVANRQFPLLADWISSSSAVSGDAGHFWSRLFRDVVGIVPPSTAAVVSAHEWTHACNLQRPVNYRVGPFVRVPGGFGDSPR